MTTDTAQPSAMLHNDLHSLTDQQRDECLARIDQDSYVVLPVKLPQHMIDGANAYIDGFCAKLDEKNGERRSENGYHQTNIIELDAIFRQFLMYLPALQMSYDVFGPMFHLGQDKWTRKYRVDEGRDPVAIGWHSDGPLGFPEVNGYAPLHTLRFGYFTSDATHDDSGTVEVIRGSHHKRTLHAQESIHFLPFSGQRQEDFETDHVTVKGEAGTIIAFHNGIWHRAQKNLSNIPRTIVYFQYCPCMIHPLHRDVPYPGDLSPYTAEERWLLGEPREPNRWVIGTDEDKQRTARFRRSADV
jgi:hypothetical protein